MCGHQFIWLANVVDSLKNWCGHKMFKLWHGLELGTWSLVLIIRLEQVSWTNIVKDFWPMSCKHNLVGLIINVVVRCSE